MVKCNKCGTMYKVACHVCYPDPSCRSCASLKKESKELCRLNNILEEQVDDARSSQYAAEKETEELRAKIAEWISVDDRLPEIPKGKYAVPVFACWYCCEDEPQVTGTVSYSGIDKGFNQLASGPKGSMCLAVEVSHWMYLPDAPDLLKPLLNDKE